MEPKEIFKFTANGAEVTGIVIKKLNTEFEQTLECRCWEEQYICYAQNRLFIHKIWIQVKKEIDPEFKPSCEDEDDYFYCLQHHSKDVETSGYSQEILIEYCVIPEYDKLLNL